MSTISQLKKKENEWQMDTIHIPDAHIRKYEEGYISQGVNKKQMAHSNQDS